VVGVAAALAVVAGAVVLVAGARAGVGVLSPQAASNPALNPRLAVAAMPFRNLRRLRPFFSVLPKIWVVSISSISLSDGGSNLPPLAMALALSTLTSVPEIKL
jgi:hypothetical protein